MKYLYFYLSNLNISIIITNITENITTGVIRTYYYYGELKEEYFVCDGKNEGIYKSYWENGQLHYEVNYPLSDG